MNVRAQAAHAEAESSALGLPSTRMMFLLLALLLALYAPVLSVMVREWLTLDEMGHGIFVPFVAGYVVWKERDALASRTFQPNWWGLVLLVGGFGQMLVGIIGADMFVSRAAFMVSLVGLLVAMGGFGLVRALALPLFLLLFMIRIPLFIYSQITFPLQLLASQLAEISLSIIGIPVLRQGNILELPRQQLSVVEACSGIRSLLSLSFLGLVYAYFLDRRSWMRPVLLVVTIPIAILSNAFRITITGILSEYKPELAEGAYHIMEGWVIFMIALAVLVVVHQLIGRSADAFSQHIRRS